MPQSDVLDKAEALTRIAKWMGWSLRTNARGGVLADLPDGGMVSLVEPTVVVAFDPFASLADAFALQTEIERRGLTAHFETKLWTALFEDCRPGDRVHRGMNWGVINANADQRTRAVLAVIEQEGGNG